jgi:hypothetical protein
MQQVDAKNAIEVAQKVKAGELPGPAKSLAEALARIYADGGRYVQKTGQMQGAARYSYAKEGDFIAAIRPLMELHGVTIRPVAQQVVTNEAFERKSGAAAYRVVILATFELLHTSGDRATVQAFGEGQDSGDKAFNKAMTGAMKYALRQTFCVETGDDPDDTPSHEQERKPVSKPEPRPAQAAPDNPGRRAALAQRFAQCASRDDFLSVCEAVKGDAAKGVLSENDRLALRAIAEETAGRFQPTKA